jgi:WD40 repeat protein
MSADGKMILAAFEEPVRLALTPDGTVGRIERVRKIARLWNTVTGQYIGKPMAHPMEIKEAQFSPDGRVLLTASVDEGVALWDGRSCRKQTAPNGRCFSGTL